MEKYAVAFLVAVEVEAENASAAERQCTVIPDMGDIERVGKLIRFNASVELIEERELAVGITEDKT